MSLQRSLKGRPRGWPEAAKRGSGAGLTTLAVVLALVLALASGAAAGGSVESSPPAPAPAPTQIRIAYIAERTERPAPLSRLDVPPADEGVAGAQLGLSDNQTTGRFTGQTFDLAVDRPGPGEDPVAAVERRLAAGYAFFVVDASAPTLLRMADALAGKEALLFNVRAADARLRDEDCRANLLHTAPDRTMLADGLAQYLIWKKWRRWLLLSGVNPGDKAYAEAIRRAARLFGGKIVEERVYDTPPGARRTDSGATLIQQQMPVFTQGAADHDVVIVADESEVFGAYVPFRTWDPRPVAGTNGLFATSWHPAYEQWGATQLQNRFERQAKRFMLPVDYQAWLAVRAVGEAATRSGSGAFGPVTAYIHSPPFELAGFKGQKLAFRPWNGQLRQPIVLAERGQTVSVSPQPGFLHRFAEADTLGIDQPESKCKMMK